VKIRQFVSREWSAHSNVMPAQAGIQYQAASLIIATVSEYWIVRLKREKTHNVR